MIKTGISGLRGTVTPNEASLTATRIVEWAQAFVGEVKERYALAVPRLALGRDARYSSEAIASLVRGALLLAGADVVDLGVTLTPTLQLSVRNDALLQGGVMVTASHNPIMWNGLKFIDDQGFFLPSEWWSGMEGRIAAADLPAVGLASGGRLTRDDTAWERHLAAALAAVPVDTIRARRFRVVLDACNGGAVRWVEFLEAVGCEVLLLHSEQHGYFAREAEPLPIHLDALQALVRHSQADIGFAADPDGDRLVLVDAAGDPVSEEHTVVLAAMAVGTEATNTVVVNVVTTHALEGAIPARVERSAVGEMNVVSGIIAHKAIMGGEGSGGIIVPHINMARDGIAAIAMILTLLATREKPLHTIIAEIPRWQTVKGKVESPSSLEGIRNLLATWQQDSPSVERSRGQIKVWSAAGNLTLACDESLRLTTTLDGEPPYTLTSPAPLGMASILTALHADEPHVVLTDGVKIVGKGAWLSLRLSNTEPIIRVMGEVQS